MLSLKKNSDIFQRFPNQILFSPSKNIFEKVCNILLVTHYRWSQNRPGNLKQQLSIFELRNL